MAIIKYKDTDGTVKELNLNSVPCLPTQGGTMTGNITLPNGGFIGRNPAYPNELKLDANGDDSGSIFVLCDKNNASNGFLVRAKSGDEYADLRGYANGTLNWNGNKIIPCSDSVHNTTDTWIPVYNQNVFDYVTKSEIAGSGIVLKETRSGNGYWMRYTRFSNGVQTISGYNSVSITNGGGGKTVTWEYPFTSWDTVVATSYTDNAYGNVLNVYPDSSFCNFWFWDSAGSTWTPRFRFFAFGFWK